VKKEATMQTVVAVSGDLMARARLEDAAARAGARLEIASVDSFSEKLRSFRPDLLLVDLDAGRGKVLERLAEAGAHGFLPRRVVGFVSHVDVELAEAARAAGCEPMPRGKFWRALPELLAR
jgi:AmiR/NasT family two-component response regulator